ncbi:MAG: substrate-binding domain-containing protein, partial [Anaerolineae bacterium]
MKNSTARFILPVLLLTALLTASCGPGTAPAPTSASEPAGPPAPTTSPPCPSIILATTTSTENSGLLRFILPDFERKTGIKVKVVAVGTGQALKLGEDGNADILLVHAPPLEEDYMPGGYGV